MFTRLAVVCKVWRLFGADVDVDNNLRMIAFIAAKV
jgi:hypothetical protein